MRFMSIFRLYSIFLVFGTFCPINALTPNVRAEPGCLIEEKKQDLIPVLARFEGGNLPENIVKFYNYLWDNSIMECMTVSLPPNLRTLSELLYEERILPTKYPLNMNELLCKMNPEKCKKGNTIYYDHHDNFTIPRYRFKKARFINKIPLGTKENMPRDIETVLRRLDLLTDSTTQEEKEKLLNSVKILNNHFKTGLYEISEKNKIPIIYIPMNGYVTEAYINPNDLSSNEILVHLIQSGKFTVLDFYMPDFSIKSHLTPGTIRQKFKKIIDTIQMPKNIEKYNRTPKVLIADKGFAEDHIYLEESRDNQDLQSFDENSITDNACIPAESNHGTHIQGIIQARVPNLIHGIAQEAEVYRLDLDKPGPEYFGDITTFLQSELMDDSYIVNLSVYIRYRETTLLRDQHFQQWKDTISRRKPKHLYVVAAGNEDQKLLADSSLELLVSLYGQPNVIVVTALDSEGQRLLVGANSGSQIVHIAAPGEEVPSTCNGNTVGLMSGTSQATAFVSSAAALLAAYNQVEPWRIKLRLQYTADILRNLQEEVRSGRLNVSRALDTNVDKICLVEELIYGKRDEIIDCRDWKKGNFVFGVRDEKRARLVKETELHLILADSRPVKVNADRILRIVGAPKNRTVFYYANDRKGEGRLERYDHVIDIFPSIRNANKSLFVWDRSAESRNTMVWHSIQIGDFVSDNQIITPAGKDD